MENQWKSPFLMGKLTISMAIFNSYVKLPEGTCLNTTNKDPWNSMEPFVDPPKNSVVSWGMFSRMSRKNAKNKRFPVTVPKPLGQLHHTPPEIRQIFRSQYLLPLRSFRHGTFFLNPLINIQKTMENHHYFQWVNPLFLWPFSIAILT